MLVVQTMPALSLRQAASPHYPFPQHVNYGANTIKPNHRSQVQLDQDVRAFYRHWKSQYLIAAGTDNQDRPLYRIALSKAGDNRRYTVSEGQGYGMLITALMAGDDPNAKTIFDGLWRFSRAHPSIIDSRLMAWKIPQPNADSAFDGDADIAYGLLLAEQQWGNAGSINYGTAAKTVIGAIAQSTIGRDSKLPLLGDWAKGNPDSAKFDQYSPRSSDFMPGHFRAYGRATRNSLWNEVITATQSVTQQIQRNYSPVTGLLSDFIVSTCPGGRNYCPPQGKFLEGPQDGDYFYNAGRVPMRLGVDALINQNSLSKQQVRKIGAWIVTKTKGDPTRIAAGYQLNGTIISSKYTYFSSFFAAPFGVAAMLTPSQQTWLNRVYSSVYQRHENYYEDSVTLLCLLIMTQNFWDPTKVPS
ncbi:MAG: glycosyl hydrolase family 8 [Thermosynechococcaceae cyanobacterium]